MRRQEWVRDVGRHAVETGRSAVVHSGPSLAGRSLCRASLAPAQTHVRRHDRGGR